MVRSITTHLVSSDIPATDYPHKIVIQNPVGDYFRVWCSEWQTDDFNLSSPSVPVIYASNRLGGDGVVITCNGTTLTITLNYPISGEVIVIGYDDTSTIAEEVRQQLDGMNVVVTSGSVTVSGEVSLTTDTINALAQAIAAALPSTS